MDFNSSRPAYGEVNVSNEMNESEAVLARADYGVSKSDEGTKIYRTIVKWALIVGVFLTPILFLPWTTSVLEFNKSLLVIAVASTGLIAWLLALVSSGRFTWRFNSFDKGVVAIFVATLAATIFSISRFNSIFGTAGNLASSLMMIFAFSIIYFLVVNSDEDQGQNLTSVVSSSLSLVFLFGFLQLVGVHLFKYLDILKFTDSNAFNFVGSVNSLGVLAAISLPLLAIKQGNKTVKYLNMLGMVMAMAILVAINWWILWTIAIVGMAGWIIFESLNNRSISTHQAFSVSKFILPMTVIVIGVFLMVVGLNFNAIKSKLPVEVAPSYGLSTDVTRSVLKESPATGYGPTAFSMAFDRYGADKLVDSTLSSAKFFSGTSEIFNTVVAGGIVMIVALLIMFWSIIQGIIRYIGNKQSGSPENAQYIWATLCAVGAAFLLYPFNMTLMFVAYIVLALTVLTLWGNESKTYDAEHNVFVSLASSLGFIGGLILVLVGAYFGVSAYVADVQYARALGETDITKASERLVDAVNWNNQSDAYYRAASQAALGLLGVELNKKVEKENTQQATVINNYMGSAINLAKKATELGPRESLNWSNLGNVYRNLLGLVGGVDALSATAYEKASSLRPGDPSFYNEIGSLYLTQSQLLRQAASGNQNAAELNQQATESLAVAETNFKKAIDMANNFGLAIYNLGIVYDRQGKLPEAIKQLEKIAPFNNDQPNLLFELGLLYYRNGDKDKSFDALQKVLVLEPDFSNASWYLALIYEERKDLPNAIAQLQKILAMEVNKDNQVVLDKLAQLQAGEISTNKVINEKPL